MTDPIKNLMKALDIPETREQYLQLAYLEPRGLTFVGPEEEAELPEDFQRPE